MVLVQKWPFLKLFFWGNIGKENVFYDILERKNAFLRHENKKFKKSKTHGFGAKMAIYPTFFWGNIGQEKMFYDILERENAFQGYKNRKFRKSKNGHFSKRVNPWFCPNLVIFWTFFFRQYRPIKFLLRYWRTKKRPSRL